MTVGISGKKVKIKSGGLPERTLITASDKLIVDNKEIKKKFYIVKKRKK